MYLDTSEVARRLGVQPRTITEYLYRARRRIAGRPKIVAGRKFPEPDEYFGGRPVWKASTIAKFERERPGRGTGGGRPSKTA